MAEPIVDLLPEPTVVEVDKIDHAVDENDAIFNEDGDLVQAFDRDKNITYKVKGKVNPLEDTPAPDADKDKDKDKAPVVDPDKDKPADDDTEEYDNPAAYILKRNGYENDEVDLGGDLGKVKIADLTPEQQIDVMVEEFDSTVDKLEAEIKTLKERAPELKFEDPAHQQIVDYLKEGGDIKKLAKEILSKDPAAQAKMLSDAEVVKLGIKKSYPSYTEQDVDDEFKEMTPAQVARRAKADRTRMESEKPDFSNLTAEQKAANDRATLQVIADFEKDVNNVKEVAKKMTSIANLPVNDKMKDFLLSQVIPKTVNEDSVFMKNLDDNPEKLLTLQYWDTYGEKLIQQTADFYYKKGIKDANGGKEKLSDTPIRTYSSGVKGSTAKQPKTIEEIADFEAFLNADF